MTGTVILQTPFVILKYHPVERIIHHEFLQRITGDELRRVLDAGLAYLIKSQATKWLSDDRKNTVLSEEDDRWVQATWFPQAMKSPWRFWAIVPPQKTAGQMQMKRYVKTTQVGNLTTASFDDPEQAFEWLGSMK